MVSRRLVLSVLFLLGPAAAPAGADTGAAEHFRTALRGQAVPPGSQPSRETRITGQPPGPIIVGAAPGEPTPLPCNLDGRLNEGRAYLPSTTPLRAVILFADFADAPSDATTPQELYDGYVPQAEAALERLSGGRLVSDITPLLRWVRIPRSYASYGFADEVAYDNHHDVIADAIRAADAEVDFSQYSAVFVIGPPTAADFPAAAEAGDNQGEGFTADGREILNAATLASATDYDRDFTGLVHETGHLLGLPDLYSYETGYPDFVGAWDVMSVTLKPNTPMLGWTRLQAGWLRKSDFLCARTSRTVVLQPVTSPGGLRAVTVPTGPRRAFVVEARTDPVSEGCRRDGVLVYRVDTRRSIAYGGGSARVIDAAPAGGSCGPHSAATFRPGKQSRYRSSDGRFGLRVLGREGSGFRVRVTVRGCTVPDLFGQRLRKARRLLRAGQCRLGKVSGSGSIVARQQPVGGLVRAAGARVAITLRRP